MPRDFDRAPKHPNRIIIEESVRETRQELSREGSIASTPYVTPEPANIEVLDEDGNLVERHDFMLGVDTLGDKAARLKVNGQKRNFFRR